MIGHIEERSLGARLMSKTYKKAGLGDPKIKKAKKAAASAEAKRVRHRRSVQKLRSMGQTKVLGKTVSKGGTQGAMKKTARELSPVKARVKQAGELAKKHKGKLAAAGAVAAGAYALHRLRKARKKKAAEKGS